VKILELDTHSLADAFPLLEGDAWERFVEDVKANGLLNKKIHTYQGKILDGRNRGRAAELLDIKVMFVPYQGDDPVSFVKSCNLHRRMYNESQRVMVVCKLADLKPGRPRKHPGARGITNAEAAAIADVSPLLVEHAKFVRAHGIPELAAAVERGDLTVTQAKKIADLEQPEQLDALKRATEPTKAARGAAAERELKTRRPSNGERHADPGLQLQRTLQRALSELGASVRPCAVPKGHYKLDVAYDEHHFTLELADVTAAESVA
jgi:hypothetical protein